ARPCHTPTSSPRRRRPLFVATLRRPFFTDPATTETSTLSLHDALPICSPRGIHGRAPVDIRRGNGAPSGLRGSRAPACRTRPVRDRKSTRLNSSHVKISYAVFCLKKKTPPTKTRAHGPTNMRELELRLA